jgi:hypothetical protein
MYSMQFDLGPGERVIWQGQPAQGFRFAPQDIFAVPFSVFWFLIVLIISGVAISGEENSIDPVFYLILPVFFSLGVYMLLGRFIVDRIARRRTRYYLTNERALIESGLFRPTLSSVSLAVVSEIKFRGGRQGRGTIQFGAAQGVVAMMPSSWPGARQYLPPTFENVDEGQKVFQLALSAQREAHAQR